MIKTLYVPLILLSVLSCSSDNTDRFTYEIVNDEKHINVTQENLINLYNLSDGEVEELLLTLHYKKEPNDNTDLSFIQKADTVSGVFQMIQIRYSPEKVVDIIWVSLDKKDRFEMFRKKFNKENEIDKEKGEVYFLRDNGQKYLVKLSDIIVGKQISILAMD